MTLTTSVMAVKLGRVLCHSGKSWPRPLTRPVFMFIAESHCARRWWPNALNDDVRRSFMLRLEFEANSRLFHVIMAASLLKAIYSTGGIEGFRLRHGMHPISDFGLIKGRVLLDTDGAANIILFRSESGPPTLTHYSDPSRHVWLYIKKASGSSFVVDLGAYAWNMSGYMIDTDTYIPSLNNERFPFYFSRRHHTRDVYIEEKRFSFLRDRAIGAIVLGSPNHRDETGTTSTPTHGMGGLVDWTGDLLGHSLSQQEAGLLRGGIAMMTASLRRSLTDGGWTEWPDHLEL